MTQPASMSVAPASRSMFPAFAGGLALGVAIGLFIGAALVPLILARTGAGGVTNDPAPVPNPKTRPPEFAPAAPAEKPAEAPTTPPPPADGAPATPAEPKPAN